MHLPILSWKYLLLSTNKKDRINLIIYKIFIKSIAWQCQINSVCGKTERMNMMEKICLTPQRWDLPVDKIKEFGSKCENTGNDLGSASRAKRATQANIVGLFAWANNNGKWSELCWGNEQHGKCWRSGVAAFLVELTMVWTRVFEQIREEIIAKPDLKSGQRVDLGRICWWEGWHTITRSFSLEDFLWKVSGGNR